MAFSLKTPLIVVMFGLTVGLTSCGGDGGSSASYDGSGTGSNGNTNSGGTDNNSPTLTYTIFDRLYDDISSIPSNLTREDIIFTNGSVTLLDKGLLKPYTPRQEGNQYEIGDHFFYKYLVNDATSAKNVKVTKPSLDTYVVNYDVFSDNQQSISHSMQLKELDISGTYDFAQKEAQGLYTWVDNQRFNKLPAVVNFPAGSGCFVFEKSTQNKVTYTFDGGNSTNYTDLDSFINSEYGVIANSIKKYNVGNNNEWQVVEYQQTNSDSPSYAVYYNGKVFEGASINNTVETENTDLSKGEVDCEPLNKVAADYIEQELLKAYK